MQFTTKLAIAGTLIAAAVVGALALLVNRHMTRLEELNEKVYSYLVKVHTQLIETGPYFHGSLEERYIKLKELTHEEVEKLLSDQPTTIKEKVLEYYEYYLTVVVKLNLNDQ